jgi:hypothetical protein
MRSYELFRQALLARKTMLACRHTLAFEGEREGYGEPCDVTSLSLESVTYPVRRRDVLLRHMFEEEKSTCT